MSNSVKVRIADQYDFNTTSTSPATFAIIPVLGLQHPESGDNVTAAGSYNITWTSKGLGAANVYLQYTPTGQTGGNWTNVTDNAVSNGASGGYYIWNPVPSGPLSNYCKLRVTYADNPNATVTGADYFRLRGAISVTAPSDGNSWQIGQSTNITWTRQGNIAAVNILYSDSNGTAGTWTTLASGTNASALSWQWNITNTTNTTAQGKIQVEDAANAGVDYGTSSGNFFIKGSLNLTSPTNASIVMTYDGSSTYNIIWAKEGGISLVNLSYSTNGGTNYNNIIGNNVSATASPYAWPIPNAIGSNLKVRIAVEGDPSVNSTSLNNFAIKGSIWVTSPNGNETWLVGSNQSIQWNTTGTYPGYANIYYSNDSGGNWTQIGTALTNDKVWYWDPVPDDIGANALIKVATNTTNASIDVNDTSNATFKIRGAVTVLEPNGNDHWFVNETTRQIR